MKDEKFKVLLYLKKGVSDKSGKTPIMGRITIGLSTKEQSVFFYHSFKLYFLT